jgi:hypothetical protein
MTCQFHWNRGKQASDGRTVETRNDAKLTWRREFQTPADPDKIRCRLWQQHQQLHFQFSTAHNGLTAVNSFRLCVSKNYIKTAVYINLPEYFRNTVVVPN